MRSDGEVEWAKTPLALVSYSSFEASLWSNSVVCTVWSGDVLKREKKKKKHQTNRQGEMQDEAMTECYYFARPLGAQVSKTSSSVHSSEKASSYRCALPTQKRRY